MILFRGGEGEGFRVGRLLLEFSVLVVGFFVSLQVNDWQNDREDRALEYEYLLRLDNDFEKSRVALADNIDKIESSLVGLEQGLSTLAQDTRDDADYQQLFLALQSASIMGSFEVFFGTYEELKDTGNMRLMQSTPLRESLGAVWQKHLQISKISQIRNMMRGNTFPVMARHVKPLAGNELTFDAEMVERNPRELYVAMSIIRSNLRYDLKDSQQLLALVQLAVTQIDEELSARSGD